MLTANAPHGVQNSWISRAATAWRLPCRFLSAVVLTVLAALMAALPAVAQAPRIPTRDTYPDTWVGTDALGRALPTYQNVGPPRPHKTVGMFYFLTFERGGDGPYDNTQILKAHPEAMADVHHPAWGPLNTSHYWGEPLFGYYASDDEWVLRKHAQMLADAGVDVVIFDNSNAVTYDKARETLCRVWEDVRRQGGRTPQIAFLCPFGNPGGMGSSTLRELYDTLYAPGRYKDLWFRWGGKPLVLADPSYADADGLRQAPPHQPAELHSGSTLGQTFTVDRPFAAAGGEFPTWNTTQSGMTLSLRANGPGGPLLARRRFEKVPDNAALLLEAGKTLPAGRYYLEMSHPTGHIGWWGYSADVYAGGRAWEDGQPAPGDRSLRVRPAGGAQVQALSPDARRMMPEAAARRARTMRDFFTFRSPIAPYDLQSPPPGHWAWLQNYPQAPQRSPTGRIEQITAGVAQNYSAVTHLAPMSFPGAFGRSFHGGHQDMRPNAVRYGYNFAEQWRRALALDPPFVFITGWNEWTAGFYQDWAGYKAPPPIFVDEFSEEYSRDIEPMRDDATAGGHGDDYYYQLVAAVRRYKGVRQTPPVTPRPINIVGSFDSWKGVTPEFRDAFGDTAHRNAPGVGKAGPYVNMTGRNDIVAAKVSYDAKNVYFYVRTAAKLTPRTGPNRMLLLLNTDADDKTGWLGYDFLVNRRVGAKTASLEKNVGGKYQWQTVADVPYRTQGSELMLAVPRALLGAARLPPAIDFKWADNCFSKTPTASEFTLNGDAAPDDRFNYRARLGKGSAK